MSYLQGVQLIREHIQETNTYICNNPGIFLVVFSTGVQTAGSQYKSCRCYSQTAKRGREEEASLPVPVQYSLNSHCYRTVDVFTSFFVYNAKDNSDKGQLCRSKAKGYRVQSFIFILFIFCWRYGSSNRDQISKFRYLCFVMEGQS